jgi:DNA-binding GntR family transcriptional regulator
MAKSRAVKRKGRSAAGRRKASAPPLPRITPTEGISVERQVYDTLRYAFMSGAIQPGIGLTSRSLSEALGVSPTPVREALKRLDADGAVVSKNKSAFFVYEPDKVDFAELFEVRMLLESRAIRNAAANASAGDMHIIGAINDEYQRLLASENRPIAYTLQVNFRFHFELYKLSRSKVLVEMIEVLWLRIGPTLQRYMPSHGDMRISVYHNRMLEAVARNDPDAAEEALRDDLMGGYQTIEPQLRARQVKA